MSRKAKLALCTKARTLSGDDYFVAVTPSTVSRGDIFKANWK